MKWVKRLKVALGLGLHRQYELVSSPPLPPSQHPGNEPGAVQEKEAKAEAFLAPPPPYVTLEAKSEPALGKEEEEEAAPASSSPSSDHSSSSDSEGPVPSLIEVSLEGAVGRLKAVWRRRRGRGGRRRRGS